MRKINRLLAILNFGGCDCSTRVHRALLREEQAGKYEERGLDQTVLYGLWLHPDLMWEDHP